MEEKYLIYMKFKKMIEFHYFLKRRGNMCLVLILLGIINLFFVYFYGEKTFLVWLSIIFYIILCAYMVFNTVKIINSYKKDIKDFEEKLKNMCINVKTNEDKRSWILNKCDEGENLFNYEIGKAK